MDTPQDSRTSLRPVLREESERSEMLYASLEGCYGRRRDSRCLRQVGRPGVPEVLLIFSNKDVGNGLPPWVWRRSISWNNGVIVVLIDRLHLVGGFMR